MEQQATLDDFEARSDSAASPPPAHTRRGPRKSAVLIAISIIALLHVYVGQRLLPALGLGSTGVLIGIALLALSSVLIPLALLAPHLSRRMPRPLEATVVWAGLLATGLASSLLILTMLRDLATLPLMAFLDAGTLRPLEEDSAWGVLGLAALVSLIGLFNARRTPRVVEIDVPLSGLPPALHGFRIAQISDIHVGPTIKHGYLARIVERVNRLDAELVAITGDLVDGSVAELAPHVTALRDLQTRYGAFFVTGNHEYYSGADAWIAELRRLGLTVLHNDHVLIEHADTALLLAGVPDYSGHHFGEHHRSDPQAALAGAPAAAARILLAHQPRSAAAAAAAGFNLQLSGHTHGGQFLPWNFFVPLQQPYVAGLLRLDQLWVYTSRGSGYWGPPMRFGAPSEITLVRLVPAEGDTALPR